MVHDVYSDVQKLGVCRYEGTGRSLSLKLIEELRKKCTSSGGGTQSEGGTSTTAGTYIHKYFHHWLSGCVCVYCYIHAYLLNAVWFIFGAPFIVFRNRFLYGFMFVYIYIYIDR